MRVGNKLKLENMVTSLISTQDGKMGMVMNLMGMNDREVRVVMRIEIYASGK